MSFKILLVILVPAVLSLNAYGQEYDNNGKYESAPDVPGFLKPVEGLKQKAKNALAGAKVPISVNLIDKALNDSVHLQGILRAESEPSYIVNSYTRMEKYSIDLSAGIGNVGNAGRLTAIGADGDFEMYYARQFPTQKASFDLVDYPPYNPISHLPLDSETVLNKLQVTDFFGMKIMANLLFGLSYSTPDTGVITANAGGYQFFDGEFYLHVFKLANNHVEVKFIGLKKDGLKGGIEVRLGPNAQFHGVRIIPKWLDRLIDPRLFEFDKEGLEMAKSPMTNGILFADYIFDLNKPEVRKAYDELFSNLYVFHNSKISFAGLKTVGSVVDPLEQNIKKIADHLIVNFTKIDQIYLADMKNGVAKENLRIDRIRTVIESKDFMTRFFWGIGRLFSKEHGTTKSDANVTTRNSNDVDEYNKHPSFSQWESMKTFWGLYRNNIAHFTDILCASNSEFNECKFQGLGVTYERTTTNYPSSERAENIAYIYRSLPSFMANQIPWGDWLEDRHRINAYIKIHFILKKEAFEQVRSRSEMIKEFYAYLEATRQGTYGASDNVGIIADNLAIILYSTNDLDRLDAFRVLRENEYFQRNGVGYLVYLSRGKDLKQILYTTVKMTSKDSTPIQWRCGKNDDIAKYKSFTDTQYVVNNRSIDPRIHDALADEKNYTECK